MPFEQAGISDLVNATATFQSSQGHLVPNSWGINTKEGDVTTDTTVNVLICAFTTFRRLAFQDQMGGSIDIRLYWVATEFPLVVKNDDAFLLTENGDAVRYIVQMEDQALYLQDTTICVCKRMV